MPFMAFENMKRNEKNVVTRTRYRKKNQRRDPLRNTNIHPLTVDRSNNITRTNDIVQVPISTRADTRNTLLDRHEELLTDTACQSGVFAMRNVGCVEDTLEQGQRSFDVERDRDGVVWVSVLDDLEAVLHILEGNVEEVLVEIQEASEQEDFVETWGTTLPVDIISM